MVLVGVTDALNGTLRRAGVNQCLGVACKEVNEFEVGGHRISLLCSSSVCVESMELEGGERTKDIAVQLFLNVCLRPERMIERRKRRLNSFDNMRLKLLRVVLHANQILPLGVLLKHLLGEPIQHALLE